MTAGLDWLTRARLGSGIVLYVYVTTHLTNHAVGLASLSAMEAGRDVFIGFWRTTPATIVLYGAFAVHIVLVLYSLYRRRTLRMPAREAVQVLFGIVLPPVLIFHIVGTRILSTYFGVDDRYAFEIFIMGVEIPAFGMAQASILVLAWVHGTMGLYFWLRLKPWFARWQPLLYAAVLTLPLAALLGFLNAVQEVRAAALDPAWVASLRAAVNWPTAEAFAQTFDIWLIATSIYGVLLLLVAGGRGVGEVAQRRRGLVTLSYPMGRRVTVTPGTSILEASRGAGIPHASVCGGRGRCSTCRVRINEGLDVCPEPDAEEVRVLVLMRETYLPPVLYLPRADVANGVLQRSERRTFCPFEGTAAYWSLKLANQTIENAVFEYERPLSAARSVGGQVAFSAGVVDHWLADDALLRAITAADWPTRLERPDAEGRR